MLATAGCPKGYLIVLLQFPPAELAVLLISPLIAIKVLELRSKLL
jgi:hypothetical protein